jgi:hypothetical protein
MKGIMKPLPTIILRAGLIGLAATLALPAKALDLLQRYPTTLTAGLLEPGQARPWQFTAQDIFKVSRFHLEVGDQLTMDTGPADLGIGHCTDGAVWAILMPAAGGKLTRQGGGSAEEIAHIWLRFHPGEINRLIPHDTVSVATPNSDLSQMRTIAGAKLRASYHAGMNAMIPEPKDMTVDVDTKAGLRRFFMVDTRAKTAGYVNAFERQPVRLAARAASGASRGQKAPKILFTKPVDGAKDVDPALAEITVTFDQDMDEGFSWTGSGPEFPPSPEGTKVQWRGKRTCVMPVKLEPAHHYQVGINSPSHQNFRSAAGDSAAPSSIGFTTK